MSSILAPREWPYRSPTRRFRSDEPIKIFRSTGSRVEERLPSGNGSKSRRAETACAGNRRRSLGPRTPARPKLGFRSAIGCAGIDGCPIHSARRSARSAPCGAEFAHRPCRRGDRTLGANTSRPNRGPRLPWASRDPGSSRNRNRALAGTSAKRRRCTHGSAGLSRGPRNSLGVRRAACSAHSLKQSKSTQSKPQSGPCRSKPSLTPSLAEALPPLNPASPPCARVPAARLNRRGPLLPHEDRASLSWRS